MATGALIGGAVLKGIGAKKRKKATKQAAKFQRETADKYHKSTYDAIERSRGVEEKRTAAEEIADKALKKANEAFKDYNDKSYGNDQETSKDWAAANAERLNLEMQNIALQAAERAEGIKRQKRSNEIYEGRANTRSQASGFGAGSSLNQWVDTIEETNRQDIAWAVSAGQSQDRLAAQDANLRFKMGESERAASDRASLLGYEAGAAKYDMYESEREANAVMREADRAQREADRQYALDRADADRYAAYSGAKTMKKQGDAGFVGDIGNIVGGVGGIASSYEKFGWGWS